MIKTNHTVHFSAAQDMSIIPDESVQEIVTSPPYPMIEMWDGVFAKQNPHITSQLIKAYPLNAFELMHRELDKVWKECFRVLSPGGLLCINIGDATRTIDGVFRLYDNHSRIAAACLDLGLFALPGIVWRKQTNAPNKFMGSGMLPCGAYITLEHEHILIFRKGSKRNYNTSEQKDIRKHSAYFWEERNIWFSDLWDLKGVKQSIRNSDSRDRSAAFPLEIPFRLINMYSQQGDTILDPFYGLGTTTQAAIVSCRNSIGFEIDESLKKSIESNLKSIGLNEYNAMLEARMKRHSDFVQKRCAEKGAFKHTNPILEMPVMTSQETSLSLYSLSDIQFSATNGLSLSVSYRPL